ncbi:hypothetical protein QO010_003376 [Caulobacter ginsengisoli]|uniref:DUF4440 domain-containing protein n=1 Tax=Caulobacter ginsengisoli TaxID=400775 RepID=A0ABU0IX97_9CAUL|nr:hypothetical protein [Caulobacter ginsengisoli]MDQ0465587.1 hypothetical protein [Caulobacter ginsengisoli]
MFKFSGSSAVAAVLAGCVVATAPVSASAQAWIGQVVGEMAAQQAAAAAEAACQAGTPPAAKDIERANADSATLLTAYFDLKSGAKSGALKKVFTFKEPTAGYVDVNGPVKFDALGARLDEPTPTLNRLSFIVGGDALSARGVWEARSGDQIVGYYAIDFQQVGIWGPSWRIWHVTLFPADQPPAATGAYCHYYQSTPWSLKGSGAAEAE